MTDATTYSQDAASPPKNTIAHAAARHADVPDGAVVYIGLTAEELRRAAAAYVPASIRSIGIGDEVIKVTGDYKLKGTVRGVFTLWDDGPVRYVVRHQAEGGGFFCHIYAGANLKLLSEVGK